MEILKNLCIRRGVSGNEKSVSQYVLNLFSKYSHECYKDNMGNVVAKINNNANFTVVIEAHLDEIGLIVNEIDDNGFIKFSPVGGVDASILPAKEVIIHGKKDVFGVIGAKPPHLMADEEKDKKLEFGNLFIDAGFTKEQIEDIVSVGDVVSFNGNFSELKNARFSSKSIDNRAGIYMLYRLLKEFINKKLNVNIVAIAAVQEELGCIGAKTAVFNINPDYAIVIDVTHGISEYIDKYKGFKLDFGPTVAVGPNFSNSYNEKLIDFCNNNKIKHQIEVCEGHSGTDAWPIQISQTGIPCSLISVPLRHMHSQVELCSMQDIEEGISIINRFLSEVIGC